MAQPRSTRGSPAAGTTPGPEPYAGVAVSHATGWVAWVLLAGILLTLLGMLHAGMGLVAVFRPEFLADTRSARLLALGDDTLAVVHLMLGAVAVVTGVGLVRGVRWARLITIVLACVACVVNFTFMSVHPGWAVTAMMLAVIVTYAIAAHGAEVAGAYGD